MKEKTVKHISTFLIALVILSLVACTGQATPVATTVPVATSAPATVPAATVPPATVAPAATMANPTAVSSGAQIEVPPVYMWMNNYTLNWVDTAKYKKAPPYKIGFSNCSTTNSWAAVFWETAKWEAQKHPEISQLYTTDAGDNSAKQLSDIEDLITKGVDLLIVRPCTLDTGVPAIEKAMKAGIPVVISNRSTSTDQYLSQQSTSKVDMGRNLAQWLADKIGGKGKIVAIEGPAGSGPQAEMWQGSEEVLAKYPDIKVVARKPTNWDQAEAKTAMEDYLQAFPDLNGVLSMAGNMSLGAAEAIDEAGLDPCKIPITGDDYNGWMKWIKAHGCDMITTDPSWSSGASIIASLMILNGQPVPKKWWMQTLVYDSTNIDKVIVPDRPDDWYPSILPPDWKIGGQ
jgi:ribose transport system substrate-binding protein